METEETIYLRISRTVSLPRQKTGTYDSLTLELVIEDLMLEAAAAILPTKRERPSFPEMESRERTSNVNTTESVLATGSTPN